MSDVFISYSRRDLTFVRRLFDALEGTQRDAWVDWEGIPYSADWWEEIKHGIDAAEVFIFVITPASLTSMICHQEVDHARQNHKRIIPIIRQEPDEKELAGEWFEKDWEDTARDNWTALKHINWLFFRETDDFDTAFSSLIESVEQDPEHVRFHTRLLVRAREWQDSAVQDSGLLLRGEDLRQAENWLQFNADKDPAPTSVHRAYIQASIDRRQREVEREQRQRQRLRILATVLALLLMVAIAAGGFAFDQRNEAENQAATAVAAQSTSDFRANENATQVIVLQTNEARAVRAEATSVRQAEEARSLLWTNAAREAFNNGDRRLALSLLVEANQIENPLPEAQQLLAELAYSPGVLRSFSWLDHDETVIAFQPSLGYALSYCGEEIRICRLEPEIRLWEIRGSQGPVLLQQTTAFPQASLGRVSPDGQRAFILGCSEINEESRDCIEDGLYLWDLVTGEIERLIPDLRHALIEFDETGENVLLWECPQSENCEGAQLSLWNLTDGVPFENRTIIASNTGFVLSIAIRSRPTPAVAAAACGEIEEIDEGTRCLQREVAVWEIVNGQPGDMTRQSEIFALYWDLEFDPLRGWLWAGGTNGTALPDDTTSSRSVFQPDVMAVVETRITTSFDTGLGAISISPTGNLVVLRGESQIRLLDSAGRTRLYEDSVSPVLTDYLLVRGELAGFLDDSTLLYLDFENRLFHHRLFHGAMQQIIDYANDDSDRWLFAPDGRSIYHANSSGVAGVDLDDLTEEEIITFANDEFLVYDPQLVSGGSQLAMMMCFSREADCSNSGVWDVTSGEHLHEYVRTERDMFPVMAVNSTGTTAAYVHCLTSKFIDDCQQAQIEVVDVASGDVQQSFSAEMATVTRLLFTPDNATLIAGGCTEQLPPQTAVGELCQGGAAVAWDVATGEALKRFEGHTVEITDIATSPDGSTVVTASQDGTVIVWNFETANPRQTLLNDWLELSGVMFTPDGKTLLVGGFQGANLSDPTITIWRTADWSLMQTWSLPVDGAFQFNIASDNKRVLVMGEDLVSVWQIDNIPAIIERVKSENLTRNLSCEERNRYTVEPPCD